VYKCEYFTRFTRLTHVILIVTTDFLYIRFIGDRTIQEQDFGKIQKDRISEMKKWARFLKKAKEEQLDRLNLVIVAASNHYAGFGSGTANTLENVGFVRNDKELF
jgi:hypothetical protein